MTLDNDEPSLCNVHSTPLHVTYPSASLSSTPPSHQIDDVEVDVDCGKDVLVGRDPALVRPAHEHLYVVHNVPGVDT